MKASSVLATLAATHAAAYPGMDRVLSEISASTPDSVPSTELLGDLADPSIPITKRGEEIRDILQGTSSPLADRATNYKAPGALGSAACAADTCCVWSYIAADMYAAMAGSPFSAGCTATARGAVRLGFHDAGAWDKSSAYGGADGSILLADGELARRENNGLAGIAATTKAWYAKYHQYGAGMADLIQLGAVVGALACPGGPRVRALVGRPDSATPAPIGKLPSPFSDAATNIALFAAKTFSASDLVALIGAHTTSTQSFAFPSRPGAPQDSTPGLWDSKYYQQTLAGNDNKTIAIFPSDRSLATSAQGRGTWTAFAAPGGVGQAAWGPAYAQAYYRMSLLGVKNVNALVDCSKVLP